MRLAVYSSIANRPLPNLVSVQNEDLIILPTVLVCPLLSDADLTSFRVAIMWETKRLLACPELTRPIRRTALHPKGWIDAEQSREIMARLQLLLAR